MRDRHPTRLDDRLASRRLSRRAVLGGAAAALLYEVLYLRPARPAPVGTAESGLDEPRPGDAALR